MAEGAEGAEGAVAAGGVAGGGTGTALCCVAAGPEAAPSFEIRLGSSIETVEKDLILRTIDLTDGNKARAAEILGISLKTLYNRLERYQSEIRSAKLA